MRERQAYLAAFIRNQCYTPGTANFATQNALMLIKFAIIERALIEALHDANVASVEDVGPRHRRAVQLLENRAVTDFRVNRN